jgi:hypothetical protein
MFSWTVVVVVVSLTVLERTKFSLSTFWSRALRGPREKKAVDGAAIAADVPFDPALSLVSSYERL